MLLNANADNDRKPIEFLLDSNQIEWRMKKFSCQKFCSDEHLVVVCIELPFFVSVAWNTATPLSEADRGEGSDGWSGDGNGSLDGMRKDNHQALAWWWSPCGQRFVISCRLPPGASFFFIC